MFHSRSHLKYLRLGKGFYAILITAVGALVALALPLIVATKSGDWAQLSDIGQAYGSIAAIFSAFALLGISGSLILQRNQIKIAQHAISRERHFELAKLILEDPSLDMESFGDFEGQELRQSIIANLWVTYWNMQWNLGQITEDNLHLHFTSLFKRPIAYRWWQVASWSGYHETRSDQKFVAVANRAHQAATLNFEVPDPDYSSIGQPTNHSTEERPSE